MCVQQILFREARAEGPGRPVASITNKMIVAGIGVYRGDACVVGALGGFCGLRGAIGAVVGGRWKFRTFARPSAFVRILERPEA